MCFAVFIVVYKGYPGKWKLLLGDENRKIYKAK